MKSNFFRRKKSLIDRKLQLSVAMMTFGYLILYTFFLLLMFGFPIWMILHITDGGEMERMAAVGKFIVEDHLFWALLTIFVVVVSLHSITVSKKIAGPIFVIRRHLKRARGGELSRLSFRGSDHFHDIKDLLNDHFDQLADSSTNIRVRTENLNNQFLALKTALGNNISGNTEAEKLLRNISEELKLLEDNSNNNCWSYSD